MVLNNVDRVVQGESVEETVRSYQLLFAKYIYEAGTKGYLQQSFRQDHQAILGDRELEAAERPVIESFEADCQQYQVVYRDELYRTGRVNKVRLLEEQQKLSLGDGVVKQLVKTVRQEFHHACDIYRELYTADLRDDGQLNDDVLDREQDRWGLGHSIVQAIASTEQSTFGSDQHEYRRVAAQTIHQTGQLEAEPLRSLQIQFSFGQSLLTRLHTDVQAEFQTHIDTYQQQFLAILRHNGVIADAERARLQGLRQSLGNINQTLLAEFEVTAMDAHEQNVQAYAEEARQVIQQFTAGNVQEPTPEEQDSLQALSHWYDLSPAIAAQIEQAVRAELSVEQPGADASQETDEGTVGTVGTVEQQAAGAAPGLSMPMEVAVPSIDAVTTNDAIAEKTDAEMTQAEAVQQIADIQIHETSGADGAGSVTVPASDLAETIESETIVEQTVADVTMSAVSEPGVDVVVDGPLTSEMSAEQVDEVDAVVEEASSNDESITLNMAISERSDDGEEVSTEVSAIATESKPEADNQDESAQVRAESVDQEEEEEDDLALEKSSKTSPVSSGSKRIWATGAAIAAGVVLVGGAIAMFRGFGGEKSVPAVDLQSNTVEIAQSGTNAVVTTPATPNIAEGTDPAATLEANVAEAMATLTEVQQFIQDRQVVSGLNLLATVPVTDNTVFEVEGILRQVFQQAEAYYQEGLYAEATTVINTMSQLFPNQKISEQAMIASKEWQNRWHANLATLKVAEDALEKQQYDSAIAEAQKVSHPGLQVQVATIIDTAIQAKQEQAALAEARKNRVPPQSGSPAPRSTVAPRRSAPAPAPRSVSPRPQAAPQPTTSSQPQEYYSPDPL